MIGKSVATVKVPFIAGIGPCSQRGDRPFLAGMAVPLRGVLLMGWWWRFAGSGLIGKSVATVRVFFIVPIGLNSQRGDRPFLVGMAATSRGCC